MSSEQFERIEDDYRTLCDTVKYKLEARIPNSSGEERKKLVREVLRETEDLLLMVTGLENEARPAPGSFRTQLMGKVRSYRREVERLQRDAQRFSGQASGRDELLSGGLYSAKSDFEAHQDTQKNRVIGGIESLNRASQSLDRTQRIAAETDEIGVGILDELDGQKEQLIRTRERVEDIDDGLSKSRRILNSMARRVITNKLILSGIILVELAILGVVIWWKFFSK
ncbi:vesicle transport through interaction with t-SNAREs homolog 1B-like [Lytechinus variegatus]|uniref:vesicle transport through interaction with t-SNAREs homolog 1B-like n=1 Tax=Lytechinus variegatus TaxID=7654 RepID=UPI001BB2B7A0|nr:vesicle transport through interaction with t-SNAREs homolog 1B-like [Lytechinus variegatus]